MENKIDFEVVLKKASALPMVKIDRKDFLCKSLGKRYDPQIVQAAVNNSPAYAGISVAEINKIAEKSINYETIKVSGISFATGLPGGFAMLGTIPADLIQYFGHILRILQKLTYLYGWKSFSDDTEFDDEASQILTLFVGLMFGVDGASKAIAKIAAAAAQKVSKSVAQKALTKGTIYPIVKKIAQSLGLKMTKEVFAKGVSKIVPVIGGAASGGITFLTFRPMAERLKKYLSGLPLADPKFYKDMKNSGNEANQQINEIIDEYLDLDYKDITEEKDLDEDVTK